MAEQTQINIPVTITGNPHHVVEHVEAAMVEATDQAEPTSRVLDGSSDHVYSEEWAEPAVMPDGRRCTRIYLFGSDEISDEPEDYPWDHEHVARIVLDGKEPVG